MGRGQRSYVSLERAMDPFLTKVCNSFVCVGGGGGGGLN